MKDTFCLWYILKKSSFNKRNNCILDDPRPCIEQSDMNQRKNNCALSQKLL
jgi:hypothetical protein